MNFRVPDRDLSEYYIVNNHDVKKPVVIPRKPEPNIFFTPIEDNREKMLKKMKDEMDNEINKTLNILPKRI